MDAKEYESTEFYSYKFKNFSTMIIIPAAILVLLLFIGSFFAVRQSTVSSLGIVEPTVVIKQKNVNYDEGQVVTKHGQKWVAHVDQDSGISLMPVMKAKNKIKIVTYVTSDKVSTIKKGQSLTFSVPTGDGLTRHLTGKVKEIGVYPVNMNKQNMYEIISTAKVNDENIKYGMQGNVTIMTGRSTYLKYLLDKVRNNK
ncbi:HlyD family efflux transporter periplasmic adaptor subunit [Lactobacillus taiwanensis]|uniref:HlyD family efflux transporter periplasmic adaptor subunit n=1 Tax=Lactobacillus taiwanensis TaxID=508451 RepID=UPI001AEC3262|nr:HlyD family efflux transporter periplasmic adaptor subunit [Lactobacillus taiwanensis]QTQ40453.1 HlyD family efflux transporter periplasmic adaptor subunit [Lactobacillus taiwanensis]